MRLNIFTTSRCNFSCFYCNRNVACGTPGYVNKYTENSEFRFRDFEFLLERYPEVKNVSFVGLGEPFLCADLIPMAELAKKRGLRTLIITNGALLDRFRGRIAPFFDCVSISIHGITAGELKEVAKVSEEVFSRFVKNIEYLVREERKLNPSLAVRASRVLVKEKYRVMEDTASFCVDRGLEILDIQNYISNDLVDVENCLYEDDFECIEFLNELKERFRNKLEINLPVPVKRNKEELSWGCREFFNTLRVDGLGNVAGCSVAMVPRAENGNIHTPGDVWNNEYFRSMRRKFLRKKDLPDCCRYCRNAQ